MFAFLKKLFKKKQQGEQDTLQSEMRQVEIQSEEPAVEYTAPLRLRSMGRGSAVSYKSGGYYSCDCLWWVSEENDADGQPIYIRESEEKTVTLPAALPFTAAGKVYRNLGQLSPQDVIDSVDTDVHGRQVLCYRERFPCFDSYDYLNEHRFYRWFFILENGRLTRIYTADESGWIHVTEDVENVETKCTELLKKHGWVE